MTIVINGITQNQLPIVPHASVSSPTTQTVIATNVEYPVLFEDDD